MFYPFDYQYYIFKPHQGQSNKTQIGDCIDQILEFVSDQDDEQITVRVNWFFNLSEHLNCGIIMDLLSRSELSKKIGVSSSFIAQPPTDGTDLQVVITSLLGIAKDKVSYHTNEEIKYVRISDDKQEWVYLGGSGCNSPDLSIREKSEISFKQIGAVLADSGLSFPDIVRQWNYISDIVSEELTDGVHMQNYQEFNEVRAHWYKNNGLSKDFPAATGIGTRGNGVRLEIVAGRVNKDFNLLSLKNPRQQNAHEYSELQLVGTVKESTPLFERGKMIFNHGRGHIWVSGTAAIRGEESIEGNCIEQTIITCENIDQLIQTDNLINSGLPHGEYSKKALYIRAYVKYSHDGPDVREFLINHYPDALVHVLQGDVCRGELLVEIEGEFSIRQIDN